MKIIAMLLSAVFAFPAFSATLDDERAVIRDVLAFHFAKTQPFYRNHVVVASKSLATPAQSAITLEGVDAPEYPLADVSAFHGDTGLEWRKAAAALPTPVQAVFEVSRPSFDPAERNAVVHLQFTKLRFAVGERFEVRFALERQADGSWKVRNSATRHLPI